MKRLRRVIALLIAAMVVVNSTDFSLLTVNATDQVATEQDPALQQEIPAGETSDPEMTEGVPETYQEEEENTQTDNPGENIPEETGETPETEPESGTGDGQDSDTNGQETASGEEGTLPGEGESGITETPSNEGQPSPDNSLPADETENPDGQQEAGMILSLDFTDEDLAAGVQDQTVQIGAGLDQVNLPDTVKVVITGQAETAEIPVKEWKIVNPEGAEFDTSASEEDPNVPKQGFYEFAPVIELAEGYAWSETVPGDGAYANWDEYLGNWMKISVTVGEENANSREIAPEGGEYTISINELSQKLTGFLTVTEGEHAGKEFAYWDKDNAQLKLLVNDAKYIFDGQARSMSIQIVFDQTVTETELELNRVAFTNRNTSILDFANVKSATVTATGSGSTISGSASPTAINIPQGTTVNLNAGTDLTISGRPDTAIQNNGVLNITGNLTIAGLADVLIYNTGTVNITGESNVAFNTSGGIAFSGGSLNVADESIMIATGVTAPILDRVQTSGILMGELRDPLSNKTLTVSGGNISRDISFSQEITTFAVSLPAGNYSITSRTDNRTAKYVGTSGNVKDTSTYTVGNTLVSYTDIYEIYSPVFWKAHAENVTFETALLVSEVDTKHYLSDNTTVNSGSMDHTWQGFQLIGIDDPEGNPMDSAEWHKAFKDDGYHEDNIYGQAVNYTHGSADAGTTYSYSLTGLMQGYTYYFIPRVVTTAGVETPILEPGETEGGLADIDEVTGTNDRKIVVKPFYLNLPETINLTYGEITGNINNPGTVTSEHPSLSMLNADSEPILPGDMIPKEQQQLGIKGTFYVYRADKAVENADDLTNTDWNAVWDAGTYGSASNQKAWITFKPDDLTRFGLVSQEVTVNVAKRPVTISSLGNMQKVYDGDTAINVQSIAAEPTTVRGEAIENCASIIDTFNKDNVGLTVSGASDGKLTGYFKDADAGESKPITIRNLILTGTNAESNYVIKADADKNDEITVEGGKITKRPITVKPKDCKIKTGEAEPDWELELADGTTLAEGDNLNDVMGSVSYTLSPEFPEFSEDAEYPSTSPYTISYSAENTSYNYTITERTGTLTIEQDEAEGFYSVSPKADDSTEYWNKSDVTISPDQSISNNRYDQVRIGIKGADGQIDWSTQYGTWKESYTISTTTTDIVVQLRDKETGAFTGWTKTEEDLKIDKTAPWIDKVQYGEYDGNPLEDVINFLTFGNYYKDKVTFTITVKDNENGSGPKTLYYKLSANEETYQEKTISEDGTVSFTIEAEGKYTIDLKVDDVAGNVAAVKLKNEKGEELKSTEWVIDKTKPQITGITVQAQDKSEIKTGKDNNLWYWDNVDVTVQLSDSEGLDMIKSQKDNDEAKESDIGKKDTATEPVKSTLYKHSITENTNGTIYKYNVSDLAGNWLYDQNNTAAWESTTGTIRIDKNDPVISGAVTIDPAAWVNAQGSVSLKFTVTDEESGVHSVEYARTENAFGEDIDTPDRKVITDIPENGEVTISGLTDAGVYTITVYDNAGRSFSTKVTVDKIDKENPGISEIEGATGETWSSSPVDLIITAFDAQETENSEVSGLGEVEYSYDGQKWISAGSWDVGASQKTITIAENGKHTVYVRVKDLAENISAVYPPQTVWVDTEQPNLTVTAKSDEKDYTAGKPTKDPVVFTLQVNKPVSGLKYYVKANGLTDGMSTDGYVEISEFIKKYPEYTWDENKGIFTVGGNVTDGEFIVNDDFSFKVESGSKLSDEETFGNVQVTITKLKVPQVDLSPADPAATGWYNENTNALTVTVYAVAGQEGQADITTKYKYWREGQAEPADKDAREVVGDSAEIVFDADDSGEYQFKAWAEDTVGSDHETEVKEFKVDLNDPEISGAISYAEINNTDFAALLNKLSFGIFFNEGIKVTVPVKDGENESGIDTLTYAVNGQNPQNAKLETNSDGKHQFTFELKLGTEGYIGLELKDKAGNTMNQNLGAELSGDGGDSPVWTLEDVPPSVGQLYGNGRSLTDESTAVWFRENVTITSKITEQKSGLKQVDYFLESGNAGTITDGTSGKFLEVKTNEYDFSKLMTTEGDHDIWVTATDNAGNVSSKQQAVVKIDKTAPTIGDVAYDQSNWNEEDENWTKVDYKATFTVNDLKGETAPEGTQTSGVASVTWTTPDGEVETLQENGGSYTGTITRNGNYTITVKDVAGNVGTKVLSITNVDKNIPAAANDTDGLTIISPTPAPEPGEPYTDDVKISVDVVDAEETEEFGQSGIDYIEWDYYSADNHPDLKRVDWNEDGPNVIEITVPGLFDVVVHVYDKAGNEAVFYENDILINNGKPGLDITATEGDDDSPYTNGTWINTNKVVFHLGMANNAPYENVKFWVKQTDSKDDTQDDELTTYTDITKFAEENSAWASWDDKNHDFIVTGEGAKNLLFAVTNGSNSNLNPADAISSAWIDRGNPANTNYTIKGENAYNPSWYTTDPVVTVGKLTESADKDKAPVSFRYKLWNILAGESSDSAEPKILSGSADNTTDLPTITKDGKWGVEYWIQDEAGNQSVHTIVSTAAGEEIWVDTTTAQAVKITVEPQDGFLDSIFGIFTNDTVKVTVSATDATSGLGLLKYEIDTDDPQNPRSGEVNFKEDSASFSISPAEATAVYEKGIRISVIDAAGNTTDMQPVTYGSGDNKGIWTIESMAPAMSLEVEASETTGENEWYKTPVKFTAEAYDAGGVNSLKLIQDGVDEPRINWIETFTDDKKSEKVTATWDTANSSDPAMSDVQGTVTVRVAASDLAGNEATGTTDNNTVRTVKIDTVKPVIGTPVLTSEAGADEWTNQSRTYQFTMTDVTSKVNPDKISITDSSGQPIDSAIDQISVSADGTQYTYQFTADENGIYTINVKDIAENQADPVTVTVEKIDKDAPENATVVIKPQEKGDDEWYNGEGTWVQAQITPPVQEEDGSPITTWYQLIDISSQPEQPQEPVKVTVEDLESRLVDIPDGQWRLRVYTEDEAGNHCKEEYSKTLRVDNTDPVIDTTSMTFTDKNNNPIENAINWLSFGTFFNDDVKVTVNISDAESGVETLYWQIPGQPEQKMDVSGKKQASITLEKELSYGNNPVLIWLEDAAGNVCGKAELKKDPSDAGNWILEGDDPVVEAVIEGNPEMGNNDWYTDPVTLYGTAQDTKSGLYEVKWNDSIKATEDDTSAEEKETIVDQYDETDLAPNFEVVEDRIVLQDGIHSISLYAKDNSTNDFETPVETYKVDSTRPTVKLTGVQEGPINDPPLIIVDVSDATSGVQSGSLEVTYQAGGQTETLENTGDPMTGYAVRVSGARAIFYATVNAVYRVTVKDKAGNISEVMTFENQLIDHIQGKERVTVNGITAVSGATTSPWYSEVPTVIIAAPDTDTEDPIDSTTTWFLASPRTEEVLGDDGYIWRKGADGQPEFNTELNGFNIQTIENKASTPENESYTIPVADFMVDGQDMDGNWILYAQSVDAAGNIGNLTKYYIRIDRGNPKISDVEQTPDNSTWASSKTVTFNVTDPEANSAPNGQVSGILDERGRVAIRQPDGTFWEYQETGADYTYTATQNGNYTIVVYDSINGRVAPGGEYLDRNYTEYSFTISGIDNTNPDNAAVSTINPENPDGNQVEGIENQHWYKSWLTIVITPPQQPADDAADASKITTHYTITNNGTTVVNDGVIQPGTEKYEHPVKANGTWVITTYTEDEAGNKSGSQTTTYYVDKDAPVIDTADIEFTTEDGGTIGNIINKLTFGIFFKETVKLTVPVREVTAGESGVAKLEYQLNSGEWTEADANGDGTYSFAITPEFKGTIKLKATDEAGNISDEKTLTNDIASGESDEDTWVVDAEKPDITIGTTDTKTGYGWYKEEVDVNVTVNGGTSGVGEAAWSMQYESDAPEDQRDIYNANDEDGIKEIVKDTVKIPGSEDADGTYTAVFNAKDNAGNAADSKTEIYHIDRKAPTLDEGKMNIPDGWMESKMITFSLSDETSGIQKDSVKITLKGENGSQDEEITGVTAAAKDGSVINGTPEDLSELAYGYDYSFRAVKNGTYHISVLDAAGNEYTEDIIINQIDDTDPEAPVIKVDDDSTADNTIQEWYNTNYPDVIGVKNDTEDTVANIAPVRTMYKMWNTETGTEPAAGTELIAAGNENTEKETAKIDTEGTWRVVMWNVDAAGNNSAETTAEFKADTVKPIFTDETDYPESFQTGYDVKFTLDDPKKEGEGHGNPSGVDRDSVSIIFQPVEGREDILSKSDYTYDEASGLYTIHVEENGVYTITAKDIAGNELGKKTITVNKISTEVPYNAEFEAAGTKGTIDGTETGWFLASENGVTVSLTIPDPTNVAEDVTIDVRYKVWENGTEEPDDSEAESVTTDDPGDVVSFNITTGGEWNIEYWTVSESGVECSARGTEIVRYDPADAVIRESGIEYTTVNDSPLAEFINWLTFGNFFNEAVKVKVPVTDEFSGANRLSYSIGMADGTVRSDHAAIQGPEDNRYAEFIIPMGTEGAVKLILTDNAGNDTAEYTMKNLNGEPTQWVIENQLPTIQSLNPELQDSGIVVIKTADTTEEPLTEVELQFSEGFRWIEGGRLTISTATEVYTATMTAEDQPEWNENYKDPVTVTIPLERFVNEAGEPLELELDETYTMVVEAGAFEDYAHNTNQEALLSAFQTQQSSTLPPEELEPLWDLDLELSEGITMNPDFDPDITGYVLVVSDEAMNGNNLAEDIVFMPELKGDAQIDRAVLTDMLGNPILDEEGNAVSYEINADGSFTVPKTDIRAYENYFIRMTSSRYGIETVYNFMVSTSAYSEVVTLATSGMPQIDVDGLSDIADFDSLTLEGNKLVVQFIASIPRTETTENELEAVKKVAGENKGYYSLDLEINEFRSDGTNTVIHETDRPVTITISLPEELLGKDSYEVYRNHDGVVTRLDSTLSDDGTKLTFASDRFSFYTIAYTPYEEDGPDIEYVEVPGDTQYIDRPGQTVTNTERTTETVTRTIYTQGGSGSVSIRTTSVNERGEEETTVEEDQKLPDTGADTKNSTGEEEDVDTISEDDLKSMFPQGLALINLAVMVISMLLTEYSYCRQKKLRKLIGSVFSIILILLFFFTQPLKGLIGLVDEWTVLFIILGVVHVIATVIPSRKKDDDDGDEEDQEDDLNEDTETVKNAVRP